MTKPEDVVFSPQSVSTMAYQVIEGRAADPNSGLTTGIPALDAVLNPHRPGELRTVLGYTSNYKSGLMNYIARTNAARFKDEAKNGGKLRVVITVTWEQSVEEQGVIDIANATGIDATSLMRGSINDGDWVRLKKASIQRGKLPWWALGHSSESNERRPRLSMSDVAHALEHITTTQNVEVGLVCLDYLQRIRREPGPTARETREQFMEIVDRAKDMALAFHTPVMLGSQSGRKVQSRQWRLPQKDDGQETSNLEQSSDSMLSVWMPKNDYPAGESVVYGDKSYLVTDDLLILGVMKQKFGIAPKIFGFRVNAAKNLIGEL